MVGLGVLLVLLLPAVPGAALRSDVGPPPFPPTISTPTVLVQNLSFGSLPTSFWGADVRIYYPLGSTQSNAINATPIQYVRWPGGAAADSYNFTANRIYNDSGTWYVPPSNESQFVTWCRTIACNAILQLPAEIDSPSTAGSYVGYTLQTLHFHPSYWEIGNEPAKWTHFGTPWSGWSTSQNTNATPGSYASVVQAYVKAIRANDPTGRIIGLPGVGTGGYNEQTWILATARLNGANLSAVAIHVYPAGGSSTTSTVNVTNFFDTLSGKGSLPYRVPRDLTTLQNACAKCGHLQLFVTELGSGTQGGPWTKFMSAFASVPYTAAELAQAMVQQVPNVDLFAFQANYSGSLLNASGAPSPTFLLYSQMLVHLQGVLLNSSITPAPSHFFFVPGRNAAGTNWSLLAVNANASNTVRLNLATSGFPILGVGSAWTWNSTSTAPVQSSWTLLAPTMWTLPPRSVLVIEIAP